MGPPQGRRCHPTSGTSTGVLAHCRLARIDAIATALPRPRPDRPLSPAPRGPNAGPARLPARIPTVPWTRQTNGYRQVVNASLTATAGWPTVYLHIFLHSGKLVAGRPCFPPASLSTAADISTSTPETPAVARTARRPPGAGAPAVHGHLCLRTCGRTRVRVVVRASRAVCASNPLPGAEPDGQGPARTGLNAKRTRGSGSAEWFSNQALPMTGTPCARRRW